MSPFWESAFYSISATIFELSNEKEVKEKPKRTRKTQKSAKEKPYVEQINELLFVHNKEDPKAGVQAVSEIDGEGKVRTVPAEEKNENSFLKFTATKKAV